MSPQLPLLLLLLATASAGCAEEFPFRNTSLPLQQRVQDLVDRLTVPELVQQLSRGGGGPFGGPAPAIPRLGVGPYQWNTECLRGAVRSGQATSFPQAIGLAATFDATLLHSVALATGFELRAKHNEFVRKGDYGDHTGLSCFAPVINIMRHPFWGRNQETYGEDPFLSATLAEAFVQGLQAENSSRYLLAAAGCKHFAAYDGPDSFPVSRFVFDAVVSEQDLQQTFLPQFERCVGAGSRSVMCSYNSLNGVPACSNRRLLTDVLRRDWNFKGYVISDAGALEFSIFFHKFFKSPLDAAVGSFRSGLNLELSVCPLGDCAVFSQLETAAQVGMVTEQELRAAAAPLFRTRMELGEFDPASMNPYANLTVDQFVQSRLHRELSLLAAQSSLVLLKNSGGFLPDGLKPQQRIGVIGPLSDQMSLVYGSYSATRNPEFETRLLRGLGARFPSVRHRTFCLDGVYCQRRNSTAAAELAGISDVIILVLGTSVLVETESLDRRSLHLPAGQEALLQQVMDAGKPTVLLVVSGGAVVLDAAHRSDSVKAILWCGYPAQTFGDAVASVITGQFNPYAALPFTWYSGANPLPDITNYRMTNQTYRYANVSDARATPLYHFGHGLSYCDLRLADLRLRNSTIEAGHHLHFTFSITNASPRSCQFVAKAYVAPLVVKDNNPSRWLASVSKQLLRAGRGVSASMRVLSRDLRQWHAASQSLRVLPADYRLVVGDYFDAACAACRLDTVFTIAA